MIIQLWHTENERKKMRGREGEVCMKMPVIWILCKMGLALLLLISSKQQPGWHLHPALLLTKRIRMRYFTSFSLSDSIPSRAHCRRKFYLANSDRECLGISGAAAGHNQAGDVSSGQEGSAVFEAALQNWNQPPVSWNRTRPTYLDLMTKWAPFECVFILKTI